jgi:hypothetical protein
MDSSVIPSFPFEITLRLSLGCDKLVMTGQGKDTDKISAKILFIRSILSKNPPFP